MVDRTNDFYEDITALPVSDRAIRGITLAWQEPARFEGLTVKEYMELGQRGSPSAGPPPEECLLMVGLPPERYLQRTVDATLSGGERKRVELASILSMGPRLSILDEPDSGIDALSLNRILDAVRTLAKDGASVLLITHQNEIAASADRASSLCGGTILRTGEEPDRRLRPLRQRGRRGSGRKRTGRAGPHRLRGDCEGEGCARKPRPEAPCNRRPRKIDARGGHRERGQEAGRDADGQRTYGRGIGGCRRPGDPPVNPR